MSSRRHDAGALASGGGGPVVTGFRRLLGRVNIGSKAKPSVRSKPKPDKMEESSAASASVPEATATEVLPTNLLKLGSLLPLEVRSSSHYEKLEVVGKGPFSHADATSEIVTSFVLDGMEFTSVFQMKTMRERCLIPLDIKHEIKILKMLCHENIIQLKELAMSPVRGNDGQGKPESKYEGSAYMVFDYMDHDLLGLVLASASQFTVPQIKVLLPFPADTKICHMTDAVDAQKAILTMLVFQCYMMQLLTAVRFCHENKVLHRDVKSNSYEPAEYVMEEITALPCANILLNNEGYLKLADFGLARILPEDDRKLTNMVVTLWYRAPELLLGETKYGSAVDMWSVGCVFGELFHGKPIFPGKTEQKQFEVICETCGTPDEDTWPGVSKLPNYQSYMQMPPVRRQVEKRFKEFKTCDCHALELLGRMLTLNPAQRISVEEALDAEYFRVDPLPCDRESLPKYAESHEYVARKRRQPPAAGQGGGPDSTSRQRHGQQ
ncbi:hypothetical protein Taro_038502 [Colocasia esculenta]|uniref:[RNA-polymerase]-subunit kinase n=1 Tax=Colocasia esculenta TaxID=4460 RepID=A0A843W6U7_COLES|nr:hypothetical protein [Colocasia esculenta]